MKDRKKIFLHFPVYESRVPWYLSGGIAAANCIAAFKPKGAADIAASYVNLATTGATWDAAAGTAPSFDTALGWTFASASSQYLNVGSGGIFSTSPYSLVCLYKASITAEHQLIGCNSAAGADWVSLAAAGQIAGDPLRFSVKHTSELNIDTTAYSANVWQTAIGVHVSATEHNVYLNGTTKATSASSMQPASLLTTNISRLQWGATDFTYGSATIGACAFYNVALSDAQAAAMNTALVALAA